MISELETGISDAASDATVENTRPNPRYSLEVTFQKNPNQKYKYLEVEPKILGVTEIVLTVFFISSKTASLTKGTEMSYLMPFSSISIIAGSLAIAAQKLHLPTLKACLGLQTVMCVIYGFLLILSTVHHQFVQIHSNFTCWQYDTHEEPRIHDPDYVICTAIMDGVTHLELLSQLIVAVQTALSATLAAYCCKVIQCCSPSSHVPVIAIKSPTAPQ